MSAKTIVMVGGTGFIGRSIASKLTFSGHRLKLLTRRRERTKQVIVLPTVELVEADVHDGDALAAQFADADAVINLTGILNETHHGDFERIHTALPGKIAAACVRTGVPRLLHMSALKATSDAPSEYLRSKAAGEENAWEAAGDSVDVTMFRPSVVFGPEDNFFNQFAALLAAIPIAFPLACASARFAPVYVEDVAQAFTNALDDKDTFGEAYNLCGPEQFSLAELVRYTAEQSGHRRTVWPLNDTFSRLQAIVMQMVPGKPFSLDNYRSMQVPNICEGEDLSELGVTPTTVGSVVPAYLGTRRRQNQYAAFRSRAGRG
jgi:uncharacterized protein YbjT (DUF2867 family)